jgi:UDP-N-acetylmuramoyl-L-alanyl-D-glutamate--2,6-diaminopimelate ligase
LSQNLITASNHEAIKAGLWLQRVLMPNAKLTSDSRALKPGDGFLAFAGERTDGRAYIEAARLAGVGAVVFDSEGASELSSERQLGVPGLRHQAGAVAASYLGDPSAALKVVALTGTNGKTSCSQWIAQGLAAPDVDTGVVGTLGQGLMDSQGSARLDTFGLTTPDAVALQTIFAKFRAEGCEYAVIEASSIGLVQSRLSGTHVQVAVFTNLTQDHLDFHGSMQAYCDAKASLFAWPSLTCAVVNLDDPASVAMLARVAASVCKIGYRISEQRESDRGWILPKVDKCVVATSIRYENSGAAFQLSGDWGDASIQLKLHGAFNVSNALAVLATWLALGMKFTDAVEKLQRLTPVAGRLQCVPKPVTANTSKLLPEVFVDYAHTPDALAKTLLALRELVKQRSGLLWCVFGAGGDRDRTKRPLMASAVEDCADRIVVTTDNPRGEAPQAILNDILVGFSPQARSASNRVFTILDRSQAIHHALTLAADNDVVLIAGKGHEDYQEIAGVKHPFSDLTCAQQALALRVAA